MKAVKRALAVASCAAIVGVAWTGSPAWADGPEVGVNAGPAIAINKFKRVVDGDVGGTVGLTGGYRWDINENFAISLIGNPQFAIFPTDEDCCTDRDDDPSGIFSITGGPKFSFMTGGPVELYTQALGGYYVDVVGPLDDDGVGFNAGGGINFMLTRNAALGIFGRYDYARMVAVSNSDVDRQWVSTGLAFNYVFRPEEVIAAEPPPPPPPPPPPAEEPPPPPVYERRGG
jgi:hypothetical protein